MSIFLKVMCAVYALSLFTNLMRLVKGEWPVVKKYEIGHVCANCFECLGFLIWIIILINK